MRITQSDAGSYVVLCSRADFREVALLAPGIGPRRRISFEFVREPGGKLLARRGVGKDHDEYAIGVLQRISQSRAEKKLGLVVEADRERGSYSGKVVRSNENVVRQEIDGESAHIEHRVADLDRRPAPGERVSINYREGRAQVQALGVEKQQQQPQPQPWYEALERDDGEVRLPDRERGRYSGVVLSADPDFVRQHVGAAGTMVHRTKHLSRQPAPGEGVTIKYQDGRGEVRERALGRGKERGRE